MTHPAIARAQAFCESYGIRVPILMAPMAGACPVALSAAVAQSGGMGACGAVLMTPDGIGDWAAEMRAVSNGAFQINLWIPDPAPVRDPDHEAEVRAFLSQFGPDVPAEAGDSTPADFEAQCQALLDAGPAVVSSIMGVYPPEFVAELKSRGIKWFATVTTVTEAMRAETAGADVIVAQGMEAGGHRGAFKAESAEANMIGLFSLLPQVVDRVDVPVVATGGVADARGVAAAMILGASAVQVGTALLTSDEAGIAPTWEELILTAHPEGTRTTRAFSGRLGRSFRTPYVEAAAKPDAPVPAPYPVQRGLTGPMRAAAAKEDSRVGMQAWMGQSAGLSRQAPAGEIITSLWDGARELLLS